MKHRGYLLLIAVIITITVVYRMRTLNTTSETAAPVDRNVYTGVIKTDEEWKQILTADQYSVLRLAGTETPYTGELLNEKRKGTYYSVGCDQPVFRSEAKYDSKTGWPSFWEPITSEALVLKEDTLIPLQVRTEVLDRCGGHLGHIFDDGPAPTGKRYCINSIALYFVPDEE